MKCQKPNDLQKTINILSTTNKQSLRNKNGIVCCGANVSNYIRPDGDGVDKSENGYTEEMAENFVDAIVQAIAFGETDSFIRVKLEAKHLIPRNLSQSPARLNGGSRVAGHSFPNPAQTLGPIGPAIELGSRQSPNPTPSISTV